MRKLNLDGVEESKEFVVLPKGLYVAKITKVEDVEDKEYLRVEVDIAEGQYKDFYKESKFKLNMIKSYKDSALPFFKSFITATEKSNDNFKFNEEKLQELVGKKLGIVLAEREYKHSSGGIRESLYIYQTRSIEEIRKGDIKIPDIKKLDGKVTGFTDITDSIIDGDLPF
ncbi:MAG: hypothetical protein RLZZ577_65 [Bacteroidota bacterium]|jgi:hypothetical protein